MPIIIPPKLYSLLQMILLLLLLLLLQSKSSHSTATVSGDHICQIIKSCQYICERHRITTEDGYQLSVHRIPPKNGTTHLRPFILMHGIIGSAADFLVSGRQRSLGSLLHEQGYDVWLPNARGTTYSKRHHYLDSSNSTFWNFTWHEIGYYDLAATVDYVLAATQQKQLHYAAHSQGSTVLLVLLSERPEYNSRIVSAALLSPVAFLRYLQSPPLLFMAREYDKLEALLNHLGLHELFPSTALNQLGGHLFCGPGVPTQNLCLLVTFLSVGFSDFEVDRALLPRVLENSPAGISKKQLLHYGQIVRSGKFHKYDYRSASENLRHYNRKTPPDYNLHNVRVPLQLFYGTRDLLLAKEDTLLLTKHLKNAPYNIIELNGFNHVDLLYATVAPRMIYKKIIGDTKRYYK